MSQKETPKIGIHIFRRDLRIYDNTSLHKCFEEMDIVIPIFIFTPEQVSSKNSYKSDKSIQFMIESLNDVEKQFQYQNKRSKVQSLVYFYGNITNVLREITSEINVHSIYINLDYTPYSKERDSGIETFCKKSSIEFNSFHDVCLFTPGSIRTDSESVYKKFTPFYNKCLENKDKLKSINKTRINNNSFIETKNIYSTIFSLQSIVQLSAMYTDLIVPNPDNQMFGGTTEGNKILKNIKKFNNYNEERNNLTKETTQLSAYLKYGCLSIRQVYEKMKSVLNPSDGLIRQLIWRDFYIHLLDAYPSVLKGKSLQEKYDKIKWGNNKIWFKKWCNGETGFPIVDACMKQLNESGYMHNRGRLIVSSFLIKILQIDWRWGEKYFAQNLIDYDPAANNGNWQWSSGSGADSQPYFRIFNPFLQSLKHDVNAEYIKKWLPQLDETNLGFNIPAKHLHEWDKYHVEYNMKEIQYFRPIVEYKVMKEKTLAMYKDALQ